MIENCTLLKLLFTHDELFQAKENTLAEDVDWKESCQNLLDSLNQSEDSRPFRESINILDLSDYREVIKHPMDLQTVGEKLRDGRYATPTDFAKDVRLIFKNSKNYFTNKMSRIYSMTIRLSILFKEQFRKILSSYGDRKIRVKSKFKSNGRFFFG